MIMSSKSKFLTNLHTVKSQCDGRCYMSATSLEMSSLMLVAQ